MNITKEQLDQLKHNELEILDEFIRICRKYNLTYVLVGGTCLGAIRHKGFIPWDDDIDVSMPREDFDRFTNLAKDELRQKYTFQSLDTEPNCGLVFGKIRKKGTIFSEVYSHHINMSQGIWIDIFPYDKVPDDSKDRNRYISRVKLLKNLYIIKCGYKMPSDKSALSKLAYLIAKLACAPVPISFFIKHLNAAMRRYSKDNKCTTVYPFGGAYSAEKEAMPEKQLHMTRMVEFEGRECNTFNDYDRYLTSLYGNYMELPPENKRRAGVHNVYELQL